MAPQSTGSAPSRPPAAGRPTRREMLARHPISPGLWAGIGILGAYLAAALSAIVVFWHSLDQLSVHQGWIPPPPIVEVYPSLAHPFGTIPGLGVDT
ncbi:MAG TPA: hypothetical protein VEH57_01200, partial [Thermoplasmata archaeon]|nr:hypothetical protein [Thermoplasmata archaeon]